MEISVEVQNLTKRFDQFTAVDSINFSVNKGEIFGFLGPNGAGKSTTIKMLCGILSPTEGSGRVSGYDIVNEQEKTVICSIKRLTLSCRCPSPRPRMSRSSAT